MCTLEDLILRNLKTVLLLSGESPFCTPSCAMLGPPSSLVYSQPFPGRCTPENRQRVSSTTGVHVNLRSSWKAKIVALECRVWLTICIDAALIVARHSQSLRLRHHLLCHALALSFSRRGGGVLVCSGHGLLHFLEISCIFTLVFGSLSWWEI